MGKIEEKKQLKKKEILSAAREIFLNEGYVQASMDKIAATAQMTKQTLYRYFPSKIELFQATLMHMGESFESDYERHLQKDDPKEALLAYAKEFVAFHTSHDHMETLRLLIAESPNAPEIVDMFFSIGHDKTEDRLTKFFKERLGIENPSMQIRLWTGMLLSCRMGILMGKEKIAKKQIEELSEAATEMLFKSIDKT